MKSTTRRLEMGEKFSYGNQGVVGFGPLEFVDPRVFNNSEEKFTHFVFRRFISGEVADAGLVDDLLPFSHRWLFVVPYGRIVDGMFWRMGKRVSEIWRVRCWVLNEPDEVMDSVFLVISNDEEDLLNYLMEFRKMWVYWLARDEIEFLSTWAKRVEMSSVSIVCTKRSPPWGVVTAAGDTVYLAINKKISWW